ncbi:hypothetical protein DPMN_089160 [Dreissena polymorpha]|uniref:Uncharacterized protein n=1 Tax=Dreissena polymorpha TaxID=45954 RepID=A0A9D4QX65_DREPO|nr:hypothetical protein DPMN_089160 [Dreissena polymorpha]
MFVPPVSLYVKDGFVEESEKRKAAIENLPDCRLPPEGSSDQRDCVVEIETRKADSNSLLDYTLPSKRPSEHQIPQKTERPTVPRKGMCTCNIL